MILVLLHCYNQLNKYHDIYKICHTFHGRLSQHKNLISPTPTQGLTYTRTHTHIVDSINSRNHVCTLCLKSIISELQKTSNYFATKLCNIAQVKNNWHNRYNHNIIGAYSKQDSTHKIAMDWSNFHMTCDIMLLLYISINKSQ